MAPVKDIDKLRRLAVKTFKLNGLSLSCDAVNYLIKVLQDFSKEEQDEWLDSIVEKVQLLTLNTSLISIDSITQAVKECGRRDEDGQDDFLHIIEAYDIPKLYYDYDRKKFLPDTNNQRILADASEKPKTFRYR